MKKKMILRTILSTIPILLIIAIGIYFYSLLNEKGKISEVDLYALIPKDCLAIIETDNVGYLFNSLEKARYTDKINELNLSQLLSGFKSNIKTLSDSKAHGFSKQMSRMVISFHQPNSIKDQILYCQLGTGDEDFIEEYIKQNTSTLFPPKQFEYRGEQIYIYPINATEFLACYYCPKFLVISFQEKLIEKVIDTYLNKSSIMKDEVFTSIVKRNKARMEATLYIKGKHVQIGEHSAENSNTIRIAHWGEFDIKLNPNAIYLSGTSFDLDTCVSFNNALKKQKPISNFSGKQIPNSAYFLSQFAVSDIDIMHRQISRKKYPLSSCTTEEEQSDSCMFEYLKENVDKKICVMMFSESSCPEEQYIIANIQLQNKEIAETELKKLLATFPKQKNKKTNHYSDGKCYQLLPLPQLAILKSFAIDNCNNKNYYGCFYRDNLLIAPDKASICAYIDQLDNSEIKEGDTLFDECIAGLAPESNCLLMAYMDKLMTMPQLYKHIMPSFFFKHKEFFQHFLLVVQFTSANGTIYPTLTMNYLDK